MEKPKIKPGEIGQFMDCDAVPRYNVNGAKGLTYTQAYHKILSDDVKRVKRARKQMRVYVPQGFERVRKLNEMYAATRGWT